VVAPFVFPDVLVLAGGGTVGHAWMSGVLAGIEDAAEVDFRRVEAFVGTSAGSIIAARLVSGRSPRRPAGGGDAGQQDGEVPVGRVERVARRAAQLGWAATAPLAPVALGLGTPPGALARAVLLSRAPDAGRTHEALRRRVESWGSRFDGRLRVCCVDKASGRRVVFGAPGAPQAEVADAVTASCAIPWVYAPVWIGGREYVDGGVWSVTNLDVAPAGRESEVLCLDPTAALADAGGRRGRLRHAFTVAAALEKQSLRQHGARVRHVRPDPGSAEAMGPDFMEDDAAPAAHTAGYAQGAAIGRDR
jgi:NTE family protein